MKIVHLMQREKFTKPISGFYDHFFPNGEHEIFYISAPGTESQINPAMTIPQHESFVELGNKKAVVGLLSRLANEYNYIVLHSFFYPVSAFVLCPKALRKLVWIAWGYDLYTQKRKGLKKHLSNMMYGIAKSRCYAFVGIFPPDCDYYRQQFPRSRAKVYYAPYISGQAPENGAAYSPDCSLDRRMEDGEPIYIQVGHSAVETMNHKRALDRLAKFKDENIRVLLPLSYGNLEYGAQVQEYAQQIFGYKAICLRDFLPKEEYFRILGRVDIGVFETYRQVALGNINRMIFQNKKLYLPENSVMYRYFQSRGVPVQRLEELNTLTFDALIRRADSHDPDAFREYMEEYTSVEMKIDRWRDIYEDLRKVLNK